MADIQESQIISNVKNGQLESYSILVEKYHRGLVIHLYNLLNNQQSAEDVAQEAFIRAYNKISLYNPEYAFSTWLYKIADNIAFRQLKQTKPQLDISKIDNNLPSGDSSLAEHTDKLFAKEAVRVAVNKLPIQYRQVISLYYWDNFSYEDIAEIMEKPVGTIRTWLFRAKDDLRKELYGQI